jgi:cytochrome c-type biogenesis protein CcmH
MSLFAVPKRPLSGLATLVCVVATAGYAWLGTAQMSAGKNREVTTQDVEALVVTLAARLKDSPGDVDDWSLLGRSYAVLGRDDQAVWALKQAVALQGADAALLTDLAEALAVASGRRLDGEPKRLVEQALTIDPNHLKALSLAGVHAFNQQDYALALRHWETLVRLAPGHPMARQVRDGIDEARQRAGSAGSTLSAFRSSVSGIVTLAPALAAKARPDDAVFIFARAADEPGMPLSMLRKQVKDLPLHFSLDDSMAVTPAAKLSAASRLVVGARIGASGHGTAQPGDLQGLSAPVAPGAAGLAIQIDEVVATR